MPTAWLAQTKLTCYAHLTSDLNKPTLHAENGNKTGEKVVKNSANFFPYPGNMIGELHRRRVFLSAESEKKERHPAIRCERSLSCSLLPERLRSGSVCVCLCVCVYMREKAERQQKNRRQERRSFGLLYSRKFSSAKNFVKSNRQPVRQEFIFVKRRLSLVCSSVIWSSLFGLSFFNIHEYF